MIVEPGPAGVLPLAERRGCPSEIREGPGAQAFKIIPLPLWRVSRSHPVVQAACDFEVSWPVANTAFTAAAEAALPMDTPAVTHLGIDGTRRGKARFRLVEAPDGGEICEVVADRWHVGLVDLVGGAGWSRSTCAPCSKPRCATRCRTSARQHVGGRRSSPRSRPASPTPPPKGSTGRSNPTPFIFTRIYANAS